MIKSFTHKGLEQFFLTGGKAGIQPQHAGRIRLILAQLHQARSLDDLRIPTLRLHELKGDRRGTWSVTVQANWRITFRFASGDAEDVDYEDYH
jgi:proteic killer suppression protein